MAKATIEARPGRWTGAERRRQVAAVALQVIARQGVQGATMGRIAEAAGISSPALYNHFSGRTELLEAATDILLERVLAWVDSSSGQDTRTISAPASSSWRTWLMVAWASDVSVLVIDWTVIGASPPTSTLPTRILRDLRRWIARQGRSAVWSWTWSLTLMWPGK